MSVVSDIKTTLKTRINNLGVAQSIYDYEETHPDGYPAVFITSDTLSSRFVTNVENRQTFNFNILAIYPTSPDLPKNASKKPVQNAEDVLYGVFDAIAKDLDQNSFNSTFATISDTDWEFLFGDAVQAEWSYVNVEGGIARAITIKLSLSLDFNVTT